jgi:radical SAM superfamily enzyme YgiQ (UPF0313 family)
LFRIVVPRYPAFNIYSRVANRTTSLGPVCVATAAHDLGGWDVEVIDENNYRTFGPRADDGTPDHRALQELRPANVVGLYGGLSSTAPRLYEVAHLYRSLGVPTIAGGQHFCGEIVAEALNNKIDVVVTGEGEETISELLPAMLNGDAVSGIDGIAYLENGEVVRTPDRAPLTDFDRFPQPDFSLVRYAKIKVYPINWTRGCGMDCEFCTVKGKPRAQSTERVFQQIRHLVEQRDAREFFMVDDLFGQHRREALRLCNMLADYQDRAGVRIGMTVQIRLDRARDIELLQAMRRAGIHSLAVGFESPIEEELEAMNKKLKPEQMVSLARLFRKAGFLVHGMFIFGYPLDGDCRFEMPTAQRVKRFRRFIRSSRIDTVQILLPVPLPGTEMMERLRRQNRVYPTEFVGWEYYDGNFPVFEPDSPTTPEQLQLAMHRIMGRFYRFRSMFLVGLYTLVFPSVIFRAHNLKKGFWGWYRYWRNSIIRFGGWRTLKRWTKEFDKGVFSDRLERAKRTLAAQATLSATDTKISKSQ